MFQNAYLLVRTFNIFQIDNLDDNDTFLSSPVTEKKKIPINFGVKQRRDRRTDQNAPVKEMLTVRKENKDYVNVFVSILIHAINFSGDVFNPVKINGFISSMQRERKCFQTELREAIGNTESVTVLRF